MGRGIGFQLSLLLLVSGPAQATDPRECQECFLSYKPVELVSCPNFDDAATDAEARNEGILRLALKNQLGHLSLLFVRYEQGDINSIDANRMVVQRKPKGGGERILVLKKNKRDLSDSFLAEQIVWDLGLDFANTAVKKGCNMAPEKNREYESQLKANADQLDYKLGDWRDR